jgi:S1-C subfamily serine protease
MNLAVSLLFLLSNPQGSAESTLERIEREVAAVVEKARPSVVQVVAQLGDAQFQSHIAQPRSIRFTGIVISADGHILSDLGGVEGARSFEVILHDGRRLEAKWKAYDRPTAVALLRIDARGLQPVEFADPALTRQGAIAVLVSNPAGLTQSSTVGFLSGVNRSIKVGGLRYDDMLQTSAAVQSGDVGGLLANSRGQLLGMIHSRYVPDGIEPDPAGFLRPVPREGLDFLPAGGPTVGFATPVSTLRFVSDRLMKFGHVQRGWAGLGLQRAKEGAQAVEVSKNGPADKAGIRRGDVVLEFDGQAVTDLAAMRRRVIEAEVPSTLRLKVRRAAATLDLEVTLQAEPTP